MSPQQDAAGPQDRPRSTNVRPLLRLLRFTWPYAGQLLLALLALVLAAGGLLAFGQVIQAVVDDGLSSGSPAMLDEELLIFLAVVAGLSLAIMLRSYLLNWIGERVVADVRKAVFARVLALDAGFFETSRTGEIIARLTSDTALLQVVVGSTLAMALRSGLLLIGGVVMLAISSPRLTGLVLAGVPLVILPSWLIGYRVRRLSRQSQDRLGDVGAYIDEALHGIRTVQSFCHEAVDRARYDDRVEAAFVAARRRSLYSALLSGLVTLLTFAAIGGVLWFGGNEVLRGNLSGGELSAFLFYAILVAGAVGSLSDIAGQLLRGAGASERLMELLETVPAIAAPARPKTLPQPVTGWVQARGLVFRYPARPETPALAGIDLNMTPGQRVALVGPSGAGKSTLFHLLLRFYDPAQGSLRLDGVELRDLDPAELRRHIAIVPQDPVIFGADAWENIRYGMLAADDAAVRAAARAAHADAFLQRLPQGYDTFLGERGVRLSGGERQRIAIARAILRDPALLLLDEATSALDAESERLVQDALERLMQGRTSIVIAHRLATVRGADRILVLDQGRIVAAGRHEELLAAGGLYARLAALQFSADQAQGPGWERPAELRPAAAW
ncbi:MAG: ATP-binding cassette domain-containing protein [Chromatiaceae bacterium]|nr:MAG: ATP-binding cassette domain-containing protein [Chromatiaceae bacterium]